MDWRCGSGPGASRILFGAKMEFPELKVEAGARKKVDGDERGTSCWSRRDLGARSHVLANKIPAAADRSQRNGSQPLDIPWASPCPDPGRVPASDSPAGKWDWGARREEGALKVLLFPGLPPSPSPQTTPARAVSTRVLLFNLHLHPRHPRRPPPPPTPGCAMTRQIPSFCLFVTSV